MDWLLLGGSLAGVLGLVLAAWLLGLGGGGIGSAAEAAAIAEEAIGPFEVEEVMLSGDDAAALVIGRDGEVVLVKQHGTQPAARRLERPLRLEAIEEGVRVDSGERRFGTVLLKLAPGDRDKLLTMV